MNQARFHAIHSGQTSVAKKVYAVTPIVEAWSSSQVSQELLRTGSSVDPRVVSGCLSALVHSGLVIQVTKDTYRRTPVRPKPEHALAAPPAPQPITTKPEPMPAAKSTTPTTKNPIDALGAIAAKLRDQAEAFEALADEIDAAALALQDRVEGSNANDELIRTMRKLFAGTGAPA